MFSTAVPRISFERQVVAGRPSIAIALVSLALVAAGACIQNWAGFSPLKQKLQKRDFAIGVEDFTKLHGLLASQGELDARQQRPLPSTLVAAGLIRDGHPTFSIVVDEADLHSPDTGIFPNALEKGRHWEREASISYFEDGVLRYETPAGLRVHGGSSRRGKIKSFALTFRRTYAGTPRAQPGVFFAGKSPAVQRIVLSNTAQVKRFLNPLALDIATAIGCETSRSQPARVILNGKVVNSGYFLLEHQSREFLRHRYGHDDFEWVRLKGESRPSLSLDLLSAWIKTKPDNITMEKLARKFDIEDLCAWMFAVTFCATLDEDQGGYYKDYTNPDDVWHSLAWDMDGSFFHGEPVDRQDVDFDRVRGLRGRIFRRLCETDAGFRAHFEAFAKDRLAGPVAPAAIQALVEKYRAYARSDVFKSKRPALLRALDETERFLLARRGIYLEDLRKFYAKAEKRR